MHQKGVEGLYRPLGIPPRIGTRVGMNYMEHIEVAEKFLDAVDILTDLGQDRVAAEVVWGAAIQAIDAANHRRTSRHAQHRERTAVVNRLQDKYGLHSELTYGFNVTRGSLHNHFYTGRLSESEIEAALVEGRRFVSAMIELAHRERADG